MKTIPTSLRLFTLLAVMLWSFQSQSQRQKNEKISPEKIAEKQTELQVQKLELDKEQARKLQAINLKYAEQKEKEMKERLKNRKESFAKMKELNQSQNQEIKTLLSQEQFENYVKLKKQNRARRRAKFAAKRKNNQEMRQDRLSVLDLSNEQKIQLRVIKMQYAEKMMAEKQKNRTEKNGKEIMTLMNSMDEEVKDILSEEQFDTYMSIRAENRKRRAAKIKNRKK